jgi:hypothetical protein
LFDLSIFIAVDKIKDCIRETTSQAPKKKHLSPSTRRRNAKRMDQWKAKREAVGENTTCVQTAFASYMVHVLVLVVYHQYLYRVNTRESDRQELDRPGRILLVLVAHQYIMTNTSSVQIIWWLQTELSVKQAMIS